MKSATVRELKTELQAKSPQAILELCLRLSRFKKENKELLTYLLFESFDEQSYIESVKEEIDEKFEQVNRKSPYFVKKSIRSILNHTKKYIRYSQNKETELELLIYFCQKLKNIFFPGDCIGANVMILISSISQSDFLGYFWRNESELLREKCTILWYFNPENIDQIRTVQH